MRFMSICVCEGTAHLDPTDIAGGLRKETAPRLSKIVHVNMRNFTSPTCICLQTILYDIILKTMQMYMQSMFFQYLEKHFPETAFANPSTSVLRWFLLHVLDTHLLVFASVLQ